MELCVTRACWLVGSAVTPLLAAAGILYAAGLHLNLTASLPTGWWVETAQAPQRGDIVKACPPEHAARLARKRGYVLFGLCAGGVQPVLKHIAALPKDVVEVSADGIRVNGAPLPHSTPALHDSGGRLLRSWPRGSYRLTTRQAWLYAPGARSFDSRYFGPVNTRSLSRRMTLVRFLGEP